MRPAVDLDGRSQGEPERRHQLVSGMAVSTWHDATLMGGSAPVKHFCKALQILEGSVG